jgi:hypothetical protein
MFAAAMRTGALATIVPLVGAVVEFFASVGRTWTVAAPGNAAIDHHLKEKRDASREALASRVE